MTIVLTVALVVGANTTIFAFCKAMLLAALPVPNPQQLSLVSIQVPDFPPDPYFSFPDLQKVKRMSAHTAMLTGFTETVDYNVGDEAGTSSTIKGQLVAGNFFSVLQVSPIAGRVLSERDNDPGREAVAVKINPKLAGYRPVQLSQLYRRIHDSIANVPGVSSVALCLYSPPGGGWGSGVWADGRPFPEPRNNNFSSWDRVTRGYFDVIGA